MTDERRLEDIDLAASEALDAASAHGLPPEVLRRLRQFQLTRAALRDDADAPSAAQIDRLVSKALLAADEVPADPRTGSPPPQSTAPVPVSSLGEHRARRMRRVAAVAAGVVLLAGAGWVLTRGPSGVETAEDASIETTADTGSEADRLAGSTEHQLPDADAPASTTAPLAGAAPSTPPPSEAGAAERSGPAGAPEDPDLSTGEQGPDSTIWQVLLEWLPGPREG